MDNDRRGPAEVTAAMYRDDSTSQMLGISVEVDEPGVAVATMAIRDDMTNGLGVCHGGLLFSLADTAMAYASNAGDQAALAAHAEIDWLRPARPGDTVVATARTVARPGRTAIHDVELHVDDELIAVFRGRTRTVGGRVEPSVGTRDT